MWWRCLMKLSYLRPNMALGAYKRPQELWSIAPPVLGAKTATALSAPCRILSRMLCLRRHLSLSSHFLYSQPSSVLRSFALCGQQTQTNPPPAELFCKRLNDGESLRDTTNLGTHVFPFCSINVFINRSQTQKPFRNEPFFHRTARCQKRLPARCEAQQQWKLNTEVKMWLRRGYQTW